ncbi:hypothetical protein [Bacillus mycoides]|uniref:Uncharacterized protein n=1 Tax=Bacillus mycoides (strain KBAB4) TaxID=315730 RepID=A9VVH4_BACMK|nr:hypothetical protein [Bacillus mycoides]ABY46789.1 conserved hypothetical protein [Bacillus mycoides KBAB4]
MEQMSLFDAPVVTVGAPPVTHTPAIDRSLAPTWEVDFYDKDKRQRLEWYRCEDEEEARECVRKEYPNLFEISYVKESSKTLEEILAYD